MSGIRKGPVVGGEVLPANILRLVAANGIWIVLLMAPFVLTYILARRGIRLPTFVRYVLRLVPVVVRAL